MTGRLTNLALVYSWGLALLFITAIYHFHADTRAIILLIGYCPITFIHLRITVGESTWKTRKAFTLLTFLWTAQVISIILSEGLRLFSDTQMIAFDFLSMILLFGIVMIVFISFCFNIPFFYTISKSKALLVIGVLGVICTLWVALMISLSLFDLHWGHWSLIHRIYGK